MQEAGWCISIYSLQKSALVVKAFSNLKHNNKGIALNKYDGEINSDWHSISFT